MDGGDAIDLATFVLRMVNPPGSSKVEGKQGLDRFDRLLDASLGGARRLGRSCSSRTESDPSPHQGKTRLPGGRR